MRIATLDAALFIAAFAGEAVLVSVLLWRKEYLRFPVFLTSIVIQLVNDPALFWILNHSSSHQYEQAYAVTSVLDYMLQLGVLIEIAHSVLRPAVSAIPRRLLGGMAGFLLIGFSITLVWTFDQHGQSRAFQQLFVHLEQVNFAFAFMRLGLFAAIAGFSQMIGITWKNHVIRLAAGLAFYSAVSLVVQLTISHLPQGNHVIYQRDYYLLNYIQTVSYLGALAFWVWSFVQKDAPRREFTPQMQRILVTISQTTRRNRAGFTRSLGHK
jgi:hypothetical protein